MTITADSLETLFRQPLAKTDGVYVARTHGLSENDRQTSDAFSEKWVTLEQESEDAEGWKQFQFKWYLDCYGYADEQALIDDLAGRRVIMDAGCGPGYKAAWFARLNPDALVIAMDLSEAINVAAARYSDVPNMIFVRGDIADTPFADGAIDWISCDQVLHHTDEPPETVKEFRRLLGPDGHLNTYVYAKKAMPRELLDEHLREHAKTMSNEQIWALSDQLTELGRQLAALNIELDVPDMPALGIKGGKQDLQRFLYWNFVKCFWNDVHGWDGSRIVNFDWYAPSNANRYSREEFIAMMRDGGFRDEFLHSEEACHSGRFV